METKYKGDHVCICFRKLNSTTSRNRHLWDPKFLQAVGVTQDDKASEVFPDPEISKTVQECNGKKMPRVIAAQQEGYEMLSEESGVMAELQKALETRQTAGKLYQKVVFT